MSKAQRSKGARVERAIVSLHHDAGISAEKVSRSGYTGEDLRIADTFTGEVKARAEAPKTIARWLGSNDFLYIKADRQEPLVVMPWRIYAALIRQYKGE